ncbi:MAG TPA: metalloregulator ArsR/SmtB family transcription factor [Candidatus Paceibacterota bacterium]|nr:metalloregulator ArsR/SmtB family transcription factor [Candidatus Paceibacterota bacterium]
MVECMQDLDTVFRSLADETRRDIIRRLRREDLSIRAIALPYPLSYADVAKHVSVLARAGLVAKTRHGKEQLVSLVPEALADADTYLASCRRAWERRLDRLEVRL